MIPFLLLLSGLSLGWFSYGAVLWGLSEFSHFQQELRLKNLAQSGKGGTLRPPFRRLLESMAGGLSRQKWLQGYFSILSTLLRRANRSDWTPLLLFAAQILLASFSAFLFGLLAGSWPLALFAFLAGASLPLFWARDLASLREARLLRELPNALEIFSLCAEAGLSLEQGMDQYVKNAKPGPLREEFVGILEQTRSGASRKESLEKTANRLDLNDFSLFSASLIQAERFGGGISKTLQQLALTMRDKQVQRAEKAVQEMPVKMLFPLVFFIMPVTFLFIFGPLLLQFFQP